MTYRQQSQASQPCGINFTVFLFTLLSNPEMIFEVHRLAYLNFIPLEKDQKDQDSSTCGFKDGTTNNLLGEIS